MVCTCMQRLDIYIFIDFFVIKYFKMEFIVIFYKEIILKTGFGQSYGKHILEMVPRKFISYFLSFISFLMHFRILNEFLKF
jgi:hypothetical protein